MDGNTILYQKADMIQPVSSDEINLRDALIDRSRQSGIDVIDDVEDGQRVLDEANSPAKMQAKRRALETASLGKNPRSLTVVSSADGAKVTQNLKKKRIGIKSIKLWKDFYWRCCNCSQRTA